MSTPAPFLSKYATLDDISLHYVEWGQQNSPPIVMLHGLRAYGLWFEDFALAIKDRFRVLAVDQRGRGKSDWARDGDYTRGAYVADVEGFVAAQGLDRFILVGHSMGGLNAIYYAARHPERLKALIIIDIGPDLDPAGMQRIRGELAATPMQFASWAAARAFLEQRHPLASAENIDTRLQWMLKGSSTGEIIWCLDPAVFDPNLRADPPEEAWALLRKISCPTLIVRGGASDLLQVVTCNRMCELMADSRWVEVPRAGHMVLEDNPDGFNTVAVDFLNQLRG